ncbi:unnamed protein product [Rotaria sp. Silwood1]|nr:unnamed protein product [Rotaria sp. Silwood1]CAF1673606.1 unnamed protein product [Rotaria sp. Silwood1]
MTNAINQLLEHQNQNASTRLIIDYLGLIKNLIQLLRYSNLFDFDQLLISIQIGSIEEIRVSEALKTDITYLLSLCEYGDLHLRGACANLLVTLIQTTNHLLTLSSLSNSFINQCSIVSTDSKDRIELLEDSIQHTTSSCTLAKVSLAQFIDDIDFRILTYLEQQQQQLKQQYPDIRVRQATASSFANVRNEDDEWERLSRQIVDLLLAHLQSQNDVLLSVNGTRDETFSAAFLRVLHDVILRILTNTRQLCVSSFYIALLLQWIHILNMLDYTQEACWSPILTPSSLITHLSISSQLQSYCDLIYHHELYVEHFISITTHYQLLLLFFI